MTTQTVNCCLWWVIRSTDNKNSKGSLYIITETEDSPLGKEQLLCFEGKRGFFPSLVHMHIMSSLWQKVQNLLGILTCVFIRYFNFCGHRREGKMEKAFGHSQRAHCDFAVCFFSTPSYQTKEKTLYTFKYSNQLLCQGHRNLAENNFPCFPVGPQRSEGLGMAGFNFFL